VPKIVDVWFVHRSTRGQLPQGARFLLVGRRQTVEFQGAEEELLPFADVDAHIQWDADGVYQD
jgi:hypothetical protein